MSRTLTDKTIALAGIFQAVTLVSRVAHRGSAEQGAFEACIKSLLVTAPNSSEDVYGSITQLRTGLEAIRQQLTSSGNKKEIELLRYAIALLHLERKLSKRADLMEKISSGIDKAQRQTEHFHPTHENVIAGLADTYLNTVSTLSPRIMVSGADTYLQNADNANKIRALLLAGIRAAVLWRQSGGSRLILLFRRRALLDEAERLLARSEDA